MTTAMGDLKTLKNIAFPRIAKAARNAGNLYRMGGDGRTIAAARRRLAQRRARTASP